MRMRARVTGWAILAALAAGSVGCGNTKTDESTNPEFKAPELPNARGGGGPPLDPTAKKKP